MVVVAQVVAVATNLAAVAITKPGAAGQTERNAFAKMRQDTGDGLNPFTRSSQLGGRQDGNPAIGFLRDSVQPAKAAVGMKGKSNGTSTGH